jgi:hypothetical protein
MKPNPVQTPPELAQSIKALQEKLPRAYLAGLQSSNPRVRTKAARGLGYLGPAAAAAIPALGALGGDRNPAVREAAHWALARIAAGVGTPSSQPWRGPRRSAR